MLRLTLPRFGIETTFVKPRDTEGFKKGAPGMPNNNPYEIDLGNGEKEDLTWLIK